jgi:hypothetical protein
VENSNVFWRLASVLVGKGRSREVNASRRLPGGSVLVTVNTPAEAFLRFASYPTMPVGRRGAKDRIGRYMCSGSKRLSTKNALHMLTSTLAKAESRLLVYRVSYCLCASYNARVYGRIDRQS